MMTDPYLDPYLKTKTKTEKQYLDDWGNLNINSALNDIRKSF